MQINFEKSFVTNDKAKNFMDHLAMQIKHKIEPRIKEKIKVIAMGEHYDKEGIIIGYDENIVTVLLIDNEEYEVDFIWLKEVVPV